MVEGSDPGKGVLLGGGRAFKRWDEGYKEEVRA